MKALLVIWQLLLPFVMPVLAQVGAAEVEQLDFSKCKTGGITELFPNIFWSPCFRCVCKTNQLGNTTDCRMRKLACPTPYCDLQEIRLSKCCRVCRGCYLNGRRYNHNVNWTDMTDPCKRYICKVGIITVYKKRCQVNCTNPIQVAGECCPSCRGCLFRGRQMLDGTTLNDPLDPCLSCSCKNGNITCSIEQCPVLACQLQPTKPQNKCCRQCEATLPKKVYSTQKWCQIHGNEVDHGKSIKINRCTSCLCQNGTALCNVETCPQNPGCEKSKLVFTGRTCCPECRNKVKCIYRDREYENRAVWYLPGCVECMCRDGLNYCKRQVCQEPKSCPQGTMLGYTVGSCCKSCISAGSSCTSYGDPHYKTFDGRFYSFQGTCKYYLAKDCKADKFVVIVKNTDRFTNQFAWTKSVMVKINNYSINLQQKRRVKVNGRRVHIPFLDFPFLDIREDDRYTYVYTNLGLTVSWDGYGFVSVRVSSSYKEQLCGLCGNYNEDSSDDLEQPNGVAALHAHAFARSWQVNSHGNSCESRNIVPRSPFSVCVGWKMYLAHKQCAALRHPIAKTCSRHVNIKPYFQSCVSDVCQCPRASKCECGALKAFMSECRRVTKKPIYLRKENECDVSCKGGSFFSNCGPGCKLTCGNFDKAATCRKPCVSGCHCPAGLVWLAQRCVLPHQCPRLAS